MKKQVYLIFMIYTTIFLSGCSGDSSSNLSVLFYWDQTGCSDPWETGPNDTNSETEIAIMAYLETNGIKIRRIYFDKNPSPDVCEACFCTTELRIVVEVSKTHISKMEELGFRQL